MHREDLLVNDGCNGQAVEAIGKSLPELDVITTLALIVESVDAIDRCAFMIAPKDEEVLGVFDLVCEQETDGFQGLLSTIDIIA